MELGIFASKCSFSVYPPRETGAQSALFNIYTTASIVRRDRANPLFLFVASPPPPPCYREPCMLRNFAPLPLSTSATGSAEVRFPAMALNYMNASVSGVPWGARCAVRTKPPSTEIGERSFVMERSNGPSKAAKAAKSSVAAIPV